MSDGEAIGIRLVEERKRLGMTQVEFAGFCDVHENSLRKYEQGTRFPNAAHIQSMQAAGVDIVYLLTGSRSTGELSAEDRYLFDMYHSLGRRERQAVMSLLMHLSGNMVPVEELPSGATRSAAFTTLQEQAQGFKAK